MRALTSVYVSSSSSYEQNISNETSCFLINDTQRCSDNPLACVSCCLQWIIKNRLLIELKINKVEA